MRLMHSCLSLQGICQAAGYIYKKLVNDGILNQAFSIAPVRSITKLRSFGCSRDRCILFQFHPSRHILGSIKVLFMVQAYKDGTAKGKT